MVRASAVTAVSLVGVVSTQDTAKSIAERAIVLILAAGSSEPGRPGRSRYCSPKREKHATLKNRLKRLTLATDGWESSG